MKPISNSVSCPKCGDNHKAKPFCVYENGFHCFSCGYSKSANRDFVKQHNIVQVSIKFPECSHNYTEFSIECQHWLAKYNISEEDVRENYIGYVAPHFLIFPNIQNGELVGYQKRNIGERWITTYGVKTPTLFANRLTDEVVLVEDFVSALRVSKQVATMCLWGTKANSFVLKQLFKKYAKILVWLDNDEEKETNSGQVAAQKIIKDCNYHIAIEKYKRGFGLVDKSVHNIVTDKDPKCYLDSEIKDYIKGACAYVATK